MKIRKPPPRSSPTIDADALVQTIRELSHPSMQGVRIHIWPTKGAGFQANVSTGIDDSWAVSTKMSPLLALQEALLSKRKIVKIHKGR